MPNLSPDDAKTKYELYDNKICTGEESAQCRTSLERRIESAQSTMEIYSPKEHSSEYSRGEYNREKAEKDEYELEIQKAKYDLLLAEIALEEA